MHAAATTSQVALIVSPWFSAKTPKAQAPINATKAKIAFFIGSPFQKICFAGIVLNFL